MAHSPCFLSPLADSLLLPFLTSLYLLGTLLAVIGSVHLGLRFLVNWPPLSQHFLQSLPPPNSQNPGYQAPHYDDLKNPASSVRNSTYTTYSFQTYCIAQIVSLTFKPLFNPLHMTWLPFSTYSLRTSLFNYKILKISFPKCIIYTFNFWIKLL